MQEFLETNILYFFMHLTRWLLFTHFIPFLGSLLLSPTIKIALSLCLSLFSFLMTIEHAVEINNLSIIIIFLLFIKELLIGFILGFLVSLLFFLYEYVGQLIDIFRGASMSQILVPQSKHQSSALGSLFFQLFLVLFITLGWHRYLIIFLYESFETFPVSNLELQDIDQSWLFFLKTIISFFKLAFKFSLPVLALCFLIDVSFGLLNRISPQINAYFLSLPAKMMAGLIMATYLVFYIFNYAKKYPKEIFFNIL